MTQTLEEQRTWLRLVEHLGSLDGKEVQRTGIVVPGAGEAGPGQSSLTFRLSAPDGGIVRQFPRAFSR